MFLVDKENRLIPFFLKKNVQIKYLLIYTICILGPGVFSALALYLQAKWELEKILFSSHIKIADSGEIFRGLMVRTNLVTFIIIVILVIMLSLYVFNRFNKHFHRMEERFSAMERGDFSLPPQQQSRFNEISALIDLSEETRQKYRQRFIDLDRLLENIDDALVSGAPAAELRSLTDRLSAHLRQIKLPNGHSSTP